jgi:protein TonB
MGLQFLGFLVKAAIVMVINISLFILIPISQRLMHSDFGARGNTSAQRRIVAEVVKPEKPKEKKTPQRRLRQVNTSQGRTMDNPMKFKFSPDLSVSSGPAGVAIRSNESEAQVFSSDEVDQPATPTYRPRPPYPDQARNLAIAGQVIVTFEVGVNGKVRRILDITAPHPSFKTTVRQTLSQWKFKPARNQGVPVVQKVRMAIDFTLDG